MPLLVTLAACDPAATPETSLVVALESMPQNLDPRFSTDASSSRIGKLIFRSLTVTDANQQHVPDLALDWRLDDLQTATFHLREDARFHDGSPVRAEDVRAVYESILDPATASPKRETLAFLDRIEVPDARTVRFRMKEPHAPFLEATTIGIVPAASVRKPHARIGSGPFRLAGADARREVRLEGAPGHRGLPKIRFRVIPDDTMRALEVRKGTVHLVENAIEADNLEWLRENSDRCVERSHGTTFHYLGMNLRRPPLADVRVRRALVWAIDRPAIVEHLLNGSARLATGLLAPTHWAYEPDVRRYEHDVAHAMRLLDDAGYPDPDGPGPGVRFRLSYKTTTLDSRRRIAEAIQAGLADVGIGVDVRSFEWGTFYDDVRRGNFELYSLAWVGVSDPDAYFNILHSKRMPPNGNNRGGYASPEADALVERGRRTFDPDERRRIYSQVQKLAADELPFLPLWWSDNVVVRDPRLCGFVPYPDGELISLRTAWWNPRAERSSPLPCGCEPAR